MLKRTQSIPIMRSRYDLHEQRYLQEEQAAMLQADYDDYRFYLRIVDGIERIQEATRCDKLRDLNQELIDRIHYTRHTMCTTGMSPPSPRVSSAPTQHSKRWNLLPKDSVPYGIREIDHSTQNVISPSDSFASTDDDEPLIFEIDL